MVFRSLLIRLSPILAHHPVVWAMAGGVLFWVWGGLLPNVFWNAVEMMIGRNLLRGYGLVMAPLDPPALWRPPLGALLCACVELFATDPFTIYRVFYALSLTTFLIATFYAARALWDPIAAHLSCLFILTSAALTSHLVNHVHSMSHVAFLFAVGPALMFTMWAIGKPTQLRLAAAGFCWGLTYLARWETLLFFAITAGVLLYAVYAQTRDFRALPRYSVALLGFAMLFIPAMIYQNWAKTRYGIWGPSAITTFYAAEAWVTGSGNESLGFAESERKYGSLESNRFSLLRAISRNPPALWARLRINVPKFFHLFTDRRFFDPLWLVLLVGLSFDVRWVRKRWLALLYLFLLFLASTTICLFEIDSRYLVIGIPSVLLILCGGVTCLGNWVNRVFGRGKWAATIAGVLLITLRPADASYHQWLAAQHNPARQGGVDTVELTRGLARNFRPAAALGRPPALMVKLAGNSGRDSTAIFLVSYFAGTAIPWYRDAAYPRDKIFSMRPKGADYLYVPEESLYQTDVLLKERPIARYEAPDDSYYLFPFTSILHVPYGDERVRAVLARDFPSLFSRLQESAAAAGLTATLEIVQNGSPAAKVACGILAVQGDGHSDQVFKLGFTVKPGSKQPMQGGAITYIELQRQEPWGVFHTSNTHYLLGVSSQRGGPLLNAADGSVNLTIREASQLWLYACDDGRNRPGTTYQCRLRIGKDGWISGGPIRLP